MKANGVVVALIAVGLLPFLTVPVLGEGEDNARLERPVRLSFEVKDRGIPAQMNYQGYLVNSGDTSAVTDSVEMTFEIFGNIVGGAPLWSETHQNVVVIRGLFNVLLGTVTSFPDTLFTGQNLWLETTIEGETLSPRKKLVSVPYAFHAKTTDGAQQQQDHDWNYWDNPPHIYAIPAVGDGYVGIGTMYPENKLHVVQSGSGRAVRVYSQDACAIWVENSGNHGLRVSQASGDGIHVDDADGYAGYFNGDGYFVGNLGIGEASPGERLDVGGNVRLTEEGVSRSLYVEKSDGIDEPGHDLEIYAGECNPVNIETLPGGDVRLRGGIGYGPAGGNVYVYGGTNGFDPFPEGDVILAHDGTEDGGKVGIGVVEPQQTLHIKDVMRLEPQAVRPFGGLGDLYVGTDSKLYFHDGADWKEVMLAP